MDKCFLSSFSNQFILLFNSMQNFLYILVLWHVYAVMRVKANNKLNLYYFFLHIILNYIFWPYSYEIILFTNFNANVCYRMYEFIVSFSLTYTDINLVCQWAKYLDVDLLMVKSCWRSPMKKIGLVPISILLLIEKKKKKQWCANT